MPQRSDRLRCHAVMPGACPGRRLGSTRGGGGSRGRGTQVSATWRTPLESSGRKGERAWTPLFFFFERGGRWVSLGTAGAFPNFPSTALRPSPLWPGVFIGRFRRRFFSARKKTELPRIFPYAQLLARQCRRTFLSVGIHGNHTSAYPPRGGGSQPTFKKAPTHIEKPTHPDPAPEGGGGLWVRGAPTIMVKKFRRLR
jgi:hypothetical protein